MVEQCPVASATNRFENQLGLFKQGVLPAVPLATRNRAFSRPDVTVEHRSESYIEQPYCYGLTRTIPIKITKGGLADAPPAQPSVETQKCG